MARRTQIKRNLVLEGVRIGFTNFSGKGGKYNREGDRNFVVFLDTDRADILASEGWKVKVLPPRDPEDEPQAYLPVSVNFRGTPPKIVMITSRGKTPLGEDEVMLLDAARFKNVDLIVRPYHWEVNGATGVKAYLQSLFVTLDEDELDLKYADVPDSAISAMTIQPVEEEPF